MECPNFVALTPKRSLVVGFTCCSYKLLLCLYIFLLNIHNNDLKHSIITVS